MLHKYGGLGTGFPSSFYECFSFFSQDYRCRVTLATVEKYTEVYER